MAWNRPTEGNGRTAPRKSAKAAGKPLSPAFVIVLVVILAVIGVACYFLFPGSKEPATDENSEAKEPAKEITFDAAKAPTNTVVEEQGKIRDHDELTVAQLRKLPLWQRSERDNMRVDPTFSNRLERFRREQAEIPWATIVDRELAMLLFPKDNNMGLLLPFDRRFKDRFLKSLETPTLVLETDSEELKEQKRELNEVKARLKEEIDAGGDVAAILNEEYDRIKKIGGLQDSLQRELREYAKTAETYEDVEDFMKAANIMLNERGGKEIKMPLTIKLKFGKQIREEPQK